MSWKEKIQAYDERRDIVIPGDNAKTLQFCVDQWIQVATHAIERNGYFSVALSGGSTPKAIYELLTNANHRNKIDWKKVLLFWGDERSVGPEDPESNFRMAMQAGFANVPIPPNQIFRMQAENDIEDNAKIYEQLILTKIPSKTFDLVMLGMGEDGHTASLFPQTHGLHATNRLVTANYVPQKDTWRMTLTFDCINQANHIAIYVIGQSKSEMVHHIFTSKYDPDHLPIQRIGTPTHKALWVLDEGAAKLIRPLA